MNLKLSSRFSISKLFRTYSLGLQKTKLISSLCLSYFLQLLLKSLNSSILNKFHSCHTTSYPNKFLTEIQPFINLNFLEYFDTCTKALISTQSIKFKTKKIFFWTACRENLKGSDFLNLKSICGLIKN